MMSQKAWWSMMVDESPTTEDSRVLLHWIPLGAGGNATVRLCGRIYEMLKAATERRPRLDLYHTALEIQLGTERFIIENAWPSPDLDTASRGVVIEGPVWSNRLSRFRAFRYEVRRWQDGAIPDVAEAAETQVLSTDPDVASRILSLTDTVPAHTWGRDVLGTGEMWNSNSVISYLLTVSGLSARKCLPPPGGRAPGWADGIALAGVLRWPDPIMGGRNR
jgi:hypothetical protein